jgi:hypothetical protein
MMFVGTYGRTFRAAALLLVSVLVAVPAVTRAFDRGGSGSTARSGFSFKRSVDRPPDKRSIAPDLMAAPGAALVELDLRAHHASFVSAADPASDIRYIAAPGPLRAPPATA